VKVGIVRRLKGAALLTLFGVFFAGIVFELVFVYPALRVAEIVSGPRPSRIQAVHRRLFGVWLSLLRLCTLLKETPAIGEPYPGPCVIVANHPGLFDVLFLAREIPRLSMLVKSALARDLPLGRIFKASGYVLSADGAHGSPVAALLEARDMIRQGYKFLLFPEGTRSPKGGLHPFKPGIFKLARMAGVPVQPVLIRNHPPFLAHGDKWRLPPFETSHIQLEFWEAVDPPEAGKEREFARLLEERYREALSLQE
jgi:1-acyl-sn-glycerol-3-phosphate acyltransferase